MSAYFDCAPEVDNYMQTPAVGLATFGRWTMNEEKHPTGAKAHLHFAALMARLNRLRKNSVKAA